MRQELIRGLIFTAAGLMAGLFATAQVKISSVSPPVQLEIKDTRGPSLEITNLDIHEGEPYYFAGDRLMMVGLVKDNIGTAFVTIDTDTIKLDNEGFFEHAVILRDGANQVKVECMDVNGNVTQINYQVIREAVTERYNTPSYLPPMPIKTGKGKYYALIIGINEYRDSRLVDLDKPVRDAERFYNILTSRYTFDKANAKLLKNPTRSDIIRTLDDLSNTVTEEDNLLIFYAGHGYWDEKKSTGYWLPTDADRDHTSNWLRNSTIQEYIEDIPSKHTLLIADACFSGGIFKTRKAFNDAPDAIEHLYGLKSRKGMTSGMLKEVPDQSVFLQYLIKRLEGNNEKYTSSLELFYQLRVPVMNNSNNTPQYGTIQNTGDEGGEFIFIKR